MALFERDKRDSEEIEFDFFDESPTREASAAESAAPKRRRRLPTRPPGGRPPAPLLRLAALILGGILLLAVLVLWISSCRAGQKTGKYESYLEDVGAVVGQSDQLGERLNTAIATPGIELSDLQSRLEGLRGEQAQVVTRAQDLDPPGTLREQQESLVDALALRVSGLAGLTQAFSQITRATGAEAAGRQLAEQSQRLVAGDVVYEDFFAEPSRQVLRAQGIEGVEVPSSNFLTTPELGNARTWTLIVRRLTEQRQGPGAGLHGNSIAGVRVQPSGQRLSPTDENTVEASERLGFDVIVENSGDSQETQVQVTFTIQQSPDPIKKQATIDIIDPGTTKVVTFRDLGRVSFGTQTTVRVNVLPVEGETNTSNNTAEYRVIFSFG